MQHTPALWAFLQQTPWQVSWQVPICHLLLIVSTFCSGVKGGGIGQPHAEGSWSQVH